MIINYYFEENTYKEEISTIGQNKGQRKTSWIYAQCAEFMRM